MFKQTAKDIIATFTQDIKLEWFTTWVALFWFSVMQSQLSLAGSLYKWAIELKAKHPNPWSSNKKKSLWFMILAEINLWLNFDMLKFDILEISCFSKY